MPRGGRVFAKRRDRHGAKVALGRCLATPLACVQFLEAGGRNLRKRDRYRGPPADGVAHSLRPASAAPSSLVPRIGRC
jgi:hypothetical protein